MDINEVALKLTVEAMERGAIPFVTTSGAGGKADTARDFNASQVAEFYKIVLKKILTPSDD